MIFGKPCSAGSLSDLQKDILRIWIAFQMADDLQRKFLPFGEKEFAPYIALLAGSRANTPPPLHILHPPSVILVKSCPSVNWILGTYGTRNPLTRSFFTEMLFLSKNRQIHKKSTFWQQTHILHSNDTFHVENTFWVTKRTLFSIYLKHYKKTNTILMFLAPWIHKKSLSHGKVHFCTRNTLSARIAHFFVK